VLRYAAAARQCCLEQWDRGFDFYSSYRSLFTFFKLFLYCVAGSTPKGSSAFKELCQVPLALELQKLICNWKRSEGVIHKMCRNGKIQGKGVKKNILI
jgi:hypothetical protein